MKQVLNYVFINNQGSHIIYDYENNIIYNTFSQENSDLMFGLLSKGLIPDTLNTRQLEFYNILNDRKIEPKNFSSYELLASADNVRGVTLMLAQDCNLRCSYCYGQEGNYNDTPQLMSKKTAEEAINYLVNRSKGNELLQVTFFGGEPLLNFDVLKHVVLICEKFKNKKFHFSITTNGTLLSGEIVDFFKKIPISIMVSLDGEKTIHDKHRKYANGKGTHNDVINAINLLKENNLSFALRATFDHEYVSLMEHNIDYMFGLGATNAYISRLSNYDIDSNEFDINVKDIFTEWQYRIDYFNRTIAKILNGEIPKYIPFYNLFDRLINATTDMIGCGIFKSSTTVSCDGSLYPCHRFVGIEGFQYGHIKTGVKTEKLKTLCNNFDSVSTKCVNCFAKYICKRACARDIAKNNGFFITYDENYCNIMKEAISIVILAYYKIRNSNPSALEKITRQQPTVQTI
ncbi:MAG: radical SAM protein [Salinivirgaceae bacterium]|nr:radical SAM protein [Salinivirgaceae bacterium]